MTRIRCRDRQCSFNKNGVCTSEEIEYEPDAGCLTMEPREETDEEPEERDDWDKENEDWDEDEDWEDEDEDWEDEDEDDEDEDEEETIASRSRKPGKR